MDFKITTFVDAGPIRFGMAREVVRQLLPGSRRTFKRHPNEPIPVDHFIEQGIVVYYKPTGTVAAVELFRPSNPVLDGVALFNSSVEQARALLWRKDAHLDIDEDGFMSHATGVGAYVLEGELNEHEPAKLISVIAFEEGYFAGRSDAKRVVCAERVKLWIDAVGESTHGPAT